MWNSIARLILRNRAFFLLAITFITLLFSTQFKYIHMSYGESNMLPHDERAYQDYEHFKDTFGKEDNFVLFALEGDKLFTPEILKDWEALMGELGQNHMIDRTLSVSDFIQLKKDTEEGRFVVEKMAPSLPETQEEADALRQRILNQPVFDGLVFNSESNTFQSLIYIKQEHVTTPARAQYIRELEKKVNNFEEKHDMDIRITGMPYIRTMNASVIVGEIELFVLLALCVTAFIFFLFFRSYRATFIAMLVVSIGVSWSMGTIGLFGYEVTILTAMIPPLIIVIGIPNVVFLLNKYHQEFVLHGNKIKGLARVITKIGNASFMTNLTTASGFATFVLTDSSLLNEFGSVASLSILYVFVLSLLLIPICYSYMQPPKAKHLKHLDKSWVDKFSQWKINVVQKYRPITYMVSILILGVSLIGVTKMYVSGSMLEDMPQDTKFIHDVRYFENQFEGVMPLEIVIDTKRKNGVNKMSTLKRMDRLEQYIDLVPEMGRPLSVVSLVKYAKQTYYNGNPDYYEMPTSNEAPFIMEYVKNSEGDVNMLQNLVDADGQVARISVLVKDVGTEEMELIHSELQKRIDKLFPAERYDVSMTGGAYVFLKGTDYLVKNLFQSLGLAVLLIAGFMAWMFRSPRMIFISLIPNLFPLIITAGLMGYFGVPIKPSTLLVFSIAFGISVDDTIHFLAKYRQELNLNNWDIKKSVLGAVKETGLSMFYTSIVLFFGFGVFTASSFGGTVALGLLVSVTLLIAMLTNLVLLPSLLLSLRKRITNKDFSEPHELLYIEEEEFEAIEAKNTAEEEIPTEV